MRYALRLTLRRRRGRAAHDELDRQLAPSFDVFACQHLQHSLHNAVRIGDHTLFGPAVQIYTPLHPFNAAQRRQQEYGKAIDIGPDVWVGGGAIILAGVRIGSRAVIGAGSVVTRDIPEGVLAAGNPCRVIREITD